MHTDYSKKIYYSLKISNFFHENFYLMFFYIVWITIWNMHTTKTRKKIGILKHEARQEERAASMLEKLFHPEAHLLAQKLIRSSSLKLEMTNELKVQARVEDLSVYKVRAERKVSKDKTRTYTYWHASWRKGGKVKNVYLGSTTQMSHDEALTKARKLKAKDLRI